VWGRLGQALVEARRTVLSVTVAPLLVRYVRDVLVAVQFHQMTSRGATLAAAEDLLVFVQYDEHITCAPPWMQPKRWWWVAAGRWRGRPGRTM
jgi:hypothetical protein